jgi:7-carboxy-7-deazaguanine synthase
LAAGYRVAIETGGDLDIRRVPREVIKIMDLKTPGSGEMHRNNYDNICHLEPKDEVKFVVTDDADVVWSLGVIRDRRLTERCHVSLSPTAVVMLAGLAERVLSSGLPVRLQTQFHKQIWPARERGI